MTCVPLSAYIVGKAGGKSRPARPYIFALFYAAIWTLHRIWDAAEHAKKLQKETGLRVFRINYYYFDALKYGRSIMAPALEQFLSLFRYADYVITNSFHGTAFSIIFERKFAVVAGANPGRLQSVLNYYGLEDRLCLSPTEICNVMNRPIDQAEVKDRIHSARNAFNDYMTELAELVKN